MKRLVLMAACSFAVADSAAAQLLPPSGRAPAPGPDAIQSCAACHGARGAGTAAGNVPRIAALPEYYIARQLRSYADGSRQNPAMEKIARSLRPEELAWFAAWFARVEAAEVRGGSTSAPAGATDLGRRLATVGSNELRLQACNNCHGPDGTGGPPAIPYLAGQGADYMIGTLNAWRAGTRSNDAGGQMAFIARAMTPEAIVAVSRFYSTLPAPPPSRVHLARASTTPDSGLPATQTVAAAARPATPERRVPAVDMSTADGARGRAILASGTHGCAGCHAIPGVRGANGIAGPPLRGIASRAFIAGQLPNRPDVLVAFIVDPPALVTATGMPNTGITREEAIDVAAYLYSLRR